MIAWNFQKIWEPANLGFPGSDTRVVIHRLRKSIKFAAFCCYTTIIFSFNLHNGAIHKHTVVGSISNLDATIFRSTMEQQKQLES